MSQPPTTEFATLSSRPVLPPPPPPPVPPFSHVPSTSMFTEPSPPSYMVDTSHNRANSFTLRERPLPQRPDAPVPTNLGNLKKTQSSRSATPEPSRRAPSRSRTREPQSSSRQYKTLPHPKRGSKHSVDMNNDGINQFAPYQFSNTETSNRRSRLSQSKMVDGSNEEKAASTAQPQPSKISATFSTLKRLLKRDKTPSRSDPDASSDPNKTSMTLSVFRHSDYQADDEELAYDVQQLSIVRFQDFRDKLINWNLLVKSCIG